MTSHVLSANLLLAYSAYFVGTASPGPSNLAIMSIAASQGRRAALTFAIGVISGSMFWATLAAVGLSAVLAAWSHFTVALKVFGGAYLLYLSFKSGQAALNKRSTAIASFGGRDTLRRLYLRGVSMHLTNPKALLVWTSIAALSASPQGAPIAAVVPGCMAIGILVFSGYALLFSINGVRHAYVHARRALEGALSAVFGVTGLSLLVSSNR